MRLHWLQFVTSSCFKPKEPISLFKTRSLYRLLCSLTGGVHELLWYCAGLHPHGCLWGPGEPSLLRAGCAAQPLAVRQLQGDSTWDRECCWCECESSAKARKDHNLIFPGWAEFSLYKCHPFLKLWTTVFLCMEIVYGKAFLILKASGWQPDLWLWGPLSVMPWRC